MQCKVAQEMSTYVVDNAGDAVTEVAGAGTDVIEASVSYTLSANVENALLTGTASINVTGNASNNTSTGNSGQTGSTAVPELTPMVGGTGNYVYVVDNTGDIVSEAATAGTDTVEFAVTYSFNHQRRKSVTLTGTAAINASGNTLANTLTGNAAANRLDGGAGADTMIGGAGNDVMSSITSGTRLPKQPAPVPIGWIFWRPPRLPLTLKI